MFRGCSPHFATISVISESTKPSRDLHNVTCQSVVRREAAHWSRRGARRVVCISSCLNHSPGLRGLIRFPAAGPEAESGKAAPGRPPRHTELPGGESI